MTDTRSTPLAPPEFAALHRHYSLRGEADIIQFLEYHPGLLSALLEAPPRIRDYFPDAPLVLEVMPDQEIPDYVLLVLFIHTTEPPEIALRQLKQVEQVCWNALPQTIKVLLCLLLEFPDEL